MGARLVILGFGVVLLGACQGDSPAESAVVEVPSEGLRGESVDPPFDVRGEAEGLLLVWFDEDGTHTAARRSDIPAARRDRVRVDSLRVAPDERLDADRIYLADMTEEGPDGYPVRVVQRSAFDDAVDQETQTEALASGDITLYGASWCNACRSAAAHLRQRGVAFVEKDIERDPGARQEMMEKARRAGLGTTGIPVIDVRGTVVSGFSAARLDALIDAPSGVL